MKICIVEEVYHNRGDDIIDYSDAPTILKEIERIRKEEYNNGLNTAISLVEEIYKTTSDDLLISIICGLQNSKK